MRRVKSHILFLLFACAGMSAFAQPRPYTCELGLQGGFGYYVGDAAHHIAMYPREAYGIHFRYKFTKRWALQAKVSGQRITGPKYEFVTGSGLQGLKDGKGDVQMWSNRLWSGDVMAEFNFLPFGDKNPFNKRIKPYTPYIFLGIGASLYNKSKNSFTGAGYIPLGIGFKWKFHERCGLNIAWQHNIYWSDDMEGDKELNNTYKLNGTNWLNCDLTGMFTIGIVFEFAKAPKVCKFCEDD